MYLLTGFIHLLLMLTQTRFVPKLDFSASEVTTTTARVSLAKQDAAVLRLPVERRPSFSLEMVRTDPKEKLRTVLRTEAKRSLFQQKIQRRNRAAAGEKLYILLGQLRTDG